MKIDYENIYALLNHSKKVKATPTKVRLLLDVITAIGNEVVKLANDAERKKE